MDKTIGIIGFGNMGQAIFRRLKSYCRIYVFDIDKNKTAGVNDTAVAGSLAELVGSTSVLILAVKPQDFRAVLREIKDYLGDKLVITIAAGISTAGIEDMLGKAKVIRAMPNLPLKVGRGMSCLCKGRFATEPQLKSVEWLFKKFGRTLIVKESMMDAATAVSGSGPGFFCDLIEGKSAQEYKKFAEQEFIPALTAAAAGLGFGTKEAKILAQQTAGGTIEYLKRQRLSAREIKKQVASKKGTTEAGLEKLQHNIANLAVAVKAAAQRAKKLAKAR